MKGLRSIGLAMGCLLAAACTALPGADPIVIDRSHTPRLIRPGSAVTFALWSSRPLPARVVTGAPRIDGVVAAGVARSGIADLRSVRGATARLPRRAGYVLPVSVLGVDPLPLAYGAATAPLARALLDGGAALTQGAAGLRGMEAGDSLRIARGRRQGDFEVRHVMPENDLFDREVIVPLDRVGRFGLPRARAVLLAVEPAKAAAAVEAVLRLAGSHPARVLALDDPQGVAGTLPVAEVKRIFGEFSFRDLPGDAIAPDPRWVRRWIVERRMPLIGTVQCHRGIVSQLSHALAEIEAARLGGLIDTYDGCYVPRMQRESAQSLSKHAFGVAFDLNAASNAQGSIPTLDERIVTIMEKWGFGWGGRWMVPDGMHFEFARFVTAEG